MWQISFCLIIFYLVIITFFGGEGGGGGGGVGRVGRGGEGGWGRGFRQVPQVDLSCSYLCHISVQFNISEKKNKRVVEDIPYLITLGNFQACICIFEILLKTRLLLPLIMVQQATISNSALGNYKSSNRRQHLEIHMTFCWLPRYTQYAI